MRRTLGPIAAGSTLLIVAVGAPLATATPAGRGHVDPAITQSYTCRTPLGDLGLAGRVTGKASIEGSTITLKKVKYAVTNAAGLSLTLDHIKVWTPDPASKAAKYKSDSVKVAGSPAGWKAGHDAGGVFASFAGSQTVNDGDDLTVAALSATYKAKGASGTVVDFHPGPVTFHVSQPISGDVTCTPDEPVGTFASVTE